jgi:CRP-like cAMP-binding protein
MASKKNIRAISDEIRNLIEISNEPQFVKKKAGETVIRKGETGNFMYIVQDGAIDIFRDDIRLERVGAGGVVGEMTLVDHDVRSASAVAHKDSVLIPIGRNRFLHLVRVNPGFALFIMNTMIKRLRHMNVRFETARRK